MAVRTAGLSMREQLHPAVLLQPLKYSEEAENITATSSWPQD